MPRTYWLKYLSLIFCTAMLIASYGCSSIDRTPSISTTSSLIGSTTTTSSHPTTTTTAATSTTHTTTITTTSITATTSTTTTTLVCYIGAFVNGLNNTPAFETTINKNLAFNMWYINWSTSFPTSDCNLVNSYNELPIITWEPYLNTSNTLDAISSGGYDAYISNFAQAAKDWGHTVFIRFAHEMNGNWYPWDGLHNGGSSGPAKYIAAWQHVCDIFNNLGVNNVLWVWSPNNQSHPSDFWNDATNYYPGDNYVDWIAIDGYNWGNGDWKTFDQLFSSVYSTFSSYNKPMMIGEFACSETGGDKGGWITDAFSKIKNNYPRFRVFVWFNMNKERDWRVNSSAAALDAFKSAIQDNYFKETPPSY